MTEKAVEIMLEKASELPEYFETTKPNTYFKSGFRCGYHQAEKDLELTWEDIASINDVVTEMLSECDDNILYDTEEKFCREVLKRFKNYKERKQQ